jgi:hypothetical protein
MSLVNATFLVNIDKNTEIFVVNLPEDYQFSPGEKLVQRQISQEMYELYKSEKYKQLKIYRYIDNNVVYNDKTIAPKGLDYKTGLTIRLFPKPYITPNGFLTKMEYFSKANYNPAIQDWVYQDLILEADFTFQVDPATEYVVSRTKTLKWYREDGTLHNETKVMFKPYSLIQMDDEAVRRRSNVVALIKIELAKFNAWVIMQKYPDPKTRPNVNDAAKALFSPFSMYMLGYANGGDKSIIAFTKNLKNPFLDYKIPWHNNMTVREFIISRIS